ncbi:E3 SUMO-protein ligase ZBED1-like [Tigriopus californicus]|uniref:E3 SUMO-protein ligase ZBED1-like n=1 Tax=Tigriopus californicus TaxID=6832 RepID=UPI0027DA73F1|nr:E3 SUMO-protein ligase ZBED1-like [Tigriopus californicus]
MVVKDLQPVSIVEDEGFKKVCHTLNPLNALPSRRTLSDIYISNMFDKVHANVKIRLQQASWVSITTDLWSSINRNGFIAVTVHYCDEVTLSPQSMILDCVRVRGRHTVETISMELRTAFERNNLGNKILVRVTDNGANVVKAIKDIGITHVACYAYSLNLVANYAFREVSSLCAIKDVASKLVEQTKKSTHVMELFEGIQ